ncbi:hypothetical protein ACWGDX_03005 [Streptomyces sp. NPDC055025]
MSSEGTRVVLVKPGDVLLIGNVGSLDTDALTNAGEAFTQLRSALGLAGIFVFEDDIDLAVTAASAQDRAEG